MLLVGCSSIKSLPELHAKLSLTNKVTFEQLDRIPLLHSPPRPYESIQSNTIYSTHSNATLKCFSDWLQTGGRLEFNELCLSAVQSDAKGSEQLENLVPKRTRRALESDLVLNGLVGIEIIQSDVDVAAFLAWAGHSANEEECESLKGRLISLRVSCKKPDYDTKKGVSFKKKPKIAIQKVEIVQPKTWAFSLDDEDVELMDEDELLDESDLIIPSTLAPGDCSTKKKACKDCSCGRAEEEEAQLLQTITVVKKKTVVSSCGSCYLGDAFRCGSCPYTGMPAFKPGEKVLLSLKSDQ